MARPRKTSANGNGYQPRLKERYEQELRPQLKQLLGPSEYASLSRSRLNAHFTTPTVIKAMWDAIERLGAGNLPSLKVLEPSAGVGRFLGLVPGLLSRGAELVEQLDTITRDGLVLAPETVAAIGRAEARRNRWTAAALWAIAILLAWLLIAR